MADTFELEQAIMNCWHVVDDIKTITNRADRLTPDELMNSLIGLSTLYQMKFEDLFDEFDRYGISTRKTNKTGVWQAEL